MSQRQKLHMQSGFRERLRELREKEGLTLQEFGYAIGYDKSYISRLESGQSENPSSEFLGACANVFGVNLDWLASGEGQMFVSHATRKARVQAIPLLEELRQSVQFDDFLRIIMSNLAPEHVSTILDDLRTSSVLTQESKNFWFPVCLDIFLRLAAQRKEAGTKTE